MPAVPSLPVLALLAGLAGSAWGQTAGIYSCVDGKGRRLTSDRPIAECIDREQKQLNANGTVRRTIGPTLTPAERAAQDERDRKEAEERQRKAEEKRLDRALLARYPSQDVHDGERLKALRTQHEAIATAQQLVGELQQQRRLLEAEARNYKNPSEWPAKLRGQMEDNDQQVAAQQRVIAGQQAESRRIGARFDEELAKLKVLWARAQGTTAAAAPSSAPPKR